MQYNSIGTNIRKFRTEKKLRQEDLAERAGLSANYIGIWYCTMFSKQGMK